MSVVGTIDTAPPEGRPYGSFVASEAFLKRRALVALIVRIVLFLAAALSVFITGAIVYILLYDSVLFFREVSIISFLTDTEWTPVFENPKFGIITLISGTLMTTFIGLLVAVPAGTILSIYLSEFARPAMRETIKPILELLAGVPTVAFGYFALFFLTPIFQWFLPELRGFNLLVPGIVIGIMILPYIVSVAEDSMRAVPDSLREGAYALGFTRFQTAVRVVIPGAFSGVTAAYILGMSRAVGETMVVAIAAGQQARLAYNPLEGAATITAYIVQISLGDLPHNSLAYLTIFVAGLTLFLMTMCFNLLAFWLRKKYRESIERVTLMSTTDVTVASSMNAPDTAVEKIDEQVLVNKANRQDLRFAITGFVVLVVAMITLMALVIDFMIDGVPRISWDFLTNYPSRRPEQAGILSAWVGTTLVMLTTAALAVPIGVAAGIYLEEYAPKNWITDVIEINVTNLAGVPSIIYGLLALGLFVYGLGLGQTIIVAGLTLALLILPIIIVATREALRSIPLEICEAAYGLGSDKWQVVKYYLLPAARPGILTGAIVGMSRAIGETAPIITIGALSFIAFLPPAPISSEFPFLNMDWLNSPFTVMPIQMFNWISRPQPGFHVAAAATGVILLAMTLLMNGLAIYIRYRIRRGAK